VVTEIDLTLPDGAILHAYDTGPGRSDELVVVWHHGTPNIGQPPRPLVEDGIRDGGIRWVSYDRPGYGGSTPAPDRPISSAATYTRFLTDALGIERFAVMGHSGGAAHALACGALLTERVMSVVSISSMAPYGADGLDYFGGMNASGIGALRSAAAGRTAKEEHEATADEYDPEFIAADIAALNGEWSWFNEVVGAALPSGPAPAIDDDLAYTAPWGFDPADIRVPVLIVHGDKDRMIPSQHGEWLAQRIPGAELWLRPNEGHISVMTTAAPTLQWLRMNDAR
jgi:pimeloyl-ACP methyl ester carboxylesterase